MQSLLLAILSPHKPEAGEGPMGSLAVSGLPDTGPVSGIDGHLTVHVPRARASANTEATGKLCFNALLQVCICRAAASLSSPTPSRRRYWVHSHGEGNRKGRRHPRGIRARREEDGSGESRRPGRVSMDGMMLPAWTVGLAARRVLDAFGGSG